VCKGRESQEGRTFPEKSDDLIAKTVDLNHPKDPLAPATRAPRRLLTIVAQTPEPEARLVSPCLDPKPAKKCLIPKKLGCQNALFRPL